jgi:tRNA(Ile)-lysidine synthase
VTDARIVSSIEETVRSALGGRSRTVLAVSGGVDSMVLLAAAARALPAEAIVVATYDHGTGSAAARASHLVVRRARALGVECVTGVADVALESEAEFRNARWRFLRATAASHSAAIATAHTENDQLETVVMRVMRGAGARGLASLYAPTDIVRPFIGMSRAQLAAYAELRELAWVEDPSNATPAYFRNRVRRDVLPALLRASPTIGSELLCLSRKAAGIRVKVEEFVGEAIRPRILANEAGLDVSSAILETQTTPSLTLLWPAIVASVGVVLDRRGLMRLMEFTTAARPGQQIQLSGGWRVVRSREFFELRRDEDPDTTLTTLSLSNTTACGDWAFRLTDELPHGPWGAWLPTDRPLAVRAWHPGDTMAAGSRGGKNKVKRLLSKAGLTGHKRVSWPVVLSGDEIVWIPGVRRGSAASDRSGRSGLPFLCEYVNC